jgi:hypothetical protein
VSERTLERELKRGAPKLATTEEFELEVEYVDFDEFLMGF